MGKLHFLTGGYEGKLGMTYGAKQRGDIFVKASPFSHRPHNVTQTKSVRAFEKLNRLSAFVAKTFWANLNLSDKKMYRHNAVAQWLKPCVKNHSFQLSNLVEVIPANSSLRITSVSFSFDERKASISFENSPLNPLVTSETILIALVSDNGTVKAGKSLNAVSQTVTLSWDLTDFATLSVVMFKSSLQGNRKIINGFCLYSETSDYVIDGVLYTSFLPLTYPPRYSNGRIVFNSADSNVVDNILHFLSLS